MMEVCEYSSVAYDELIKALKALLGHAFFSCSHVYCMKYNICDKLLYVNLAEDMSVMALLKFQSKNMCAGNNA